MVRAELGLLRSSNPYQSIVNISTGTPCHVHFSFLTSEEARNMRSQLCVYPLHHATAIRLPPRKALVFYSGNMHDLSGTLLNTSREKHPITLDPDFGRQLTSKGRSLSSRCSLYHEAGCQIEVKINKIGVRVRAALFSCGPTVPKTEPVHEPLGFCTLSVAVPKRVIILQNPSFA